MRIIRVAELDAELKRLDEAAARSDDELRKGFGEFQLSADDGFPSDPYSEAYWRHQMDLYSRIAAIDAYSLSNERTHVSNLEDAVRTPFPFYTRSAKTVGDQLMAIGFIIKTMDLPPESNILEFGPGWGNTTINLARMGYSVTAVDIEPNFIEIVRRRAELIGCPVRTLVGNFGTVPEDGERFDAVLFFECFHHCSDHVALIGQLREMVHCDGVIVFAAEPILEDFHAPWGVRLDGMALWGIRKFKWMELGFKESYFVRTMMKAGWIVSKHVCNHTSLGVVFLARRNRGLYEMGGLLIPRDDERSWAPIESDPTVGHRCTAGESVLTLDEEREWRSVSLDVVNVAPFPLDVRLQCGSEAAQFCIPPGTKAILTVGLPVTDRRLVISSLAWCPKELQINEDNRTLGVAVRRVRFNR
jgi:2-polyprenyl-3-methyl-5-hydroxy-6-metoxy-1,4-benzoquinol methylase